MALLDDDDDMPDLNWPVPLEPIGLALIMKPQLKKYEEVKPEKQGIYFVCYEYKPKQLYIDKYRDSLLDKKMRWLDGDPVWWCEIVLPDGCELNYWSY